MIEHPDHTGASANPAAPWNQPDAPECSACGAQMTEVCRSCDAPVCDNPDCDNRQCDGYCPDCYDGPSDEQQWAAAEAASLSPPPDTRGEHDV